MKMRRVREKLLIVLSFFVACLLSIAPLPPWALWLRPEWVLLVLMYWVLITPEQVGFGTAFMAGLLLDGLHGDLLGQYALIALIVTYLTLHLQRRMRLFPLWQQSLCVLIIIGCAELILLWIRGLTHQPSLDGRFWLITFSSALFWPLVYLWLQVYRQKLR